MTLSFHNLIDKTNERSIINFLSIVISRILDDIEDIDFEKIKDTFQLSTALGIDLDGIAEFFNSKRGLDESDETLRTRLTLIIGANVGSSVDAIQDLFEYITSLRPVIVEDFETKIYQVGEIKDVSEEIGAFQIYFNLDITDVFETLYINSDGNSVTIGHSSNIDGGGTIAAYDHTNDPAHTTDIADTLDASTGIMTLTGGPYPPLNKIWVEYQIIPSADYDTIEELYANKPILQSVLNLAKAAGIKTYDIEFVKFFRALLNNVGYEIITATDEFNITGFGMEELYTGVINDGWDGKYWNSSHWDGNILVVAQDIFNWFGNPSNHYSEITIVP